MEYWPWYEECTTNTAATVVVVDGVKVLWPKASSCDTNFGV